MQGAPSPAAQAQIQRMFNQPKKDATTSALQGYASATSVSPGETITLHVHAERPHRNFKIDIYRKGKEESLVHTGSGSALPHNTPANAYEIGCGWPSAYELKIPAGWSSGVYIARLTSIPKGSLFEPVTTDILFVVKAAALGTNSKILFQLAVNTNQAYNNWGGKSLYGNGSASTKVSFDRPSLDGIFYEFEYDFVRWLEDNCFEVEYCTNIDLHADSDFLNNYRLLLSVGHDEYWSWEMRDNVEAFIGNGGNAAFFGGNVCWWQVRFEDNNRTMVCYKNADNDPLTGTPQATRVTINWRNPPVDRPENSLTGVSYANGAAWYGTQNPRPVVDYRVRFGRHWVFDGTGLNDGDGFGADNLIVGYETDAALFDDINGVPVVTGTDGTPLNFLVLATADCKNWGEVRAGMATMGVFRNRGTVFTAATTDWYQGLKDDWNAVSQITWNVLKRLSMPCPPSPHLANSGFEKWTAPNIPDFWSLEGQGTVSEDKTAARNGHCSLKVNATNQTWISQRFDCEGRNYYRVGCWAKANQPGASIRLQSTATWKTFAIAQHSGSGTWEYLCAVGMVDDEGPLFVARVKIQVAEGMAWFDDVRLDAL